MRLRSLFARLVARFRWWRTNPAASNSQGRGALEDGLERWKVEFRESCFLQSLLPMPLPLTAIRLLRRPPHAPREQSVSRGETASVAADPHGAELVGDVEMSSFDDDPFVRPAHLEKLSKDEFYLDERGRPVGLAGPRARISEPETIGVQAGAGIRPVATNPWFLPMPNADGNFIFVEEPRFPVHQVLRTSDGRIARTPQGLEIWEKRDHHLGQTSVFEAIVTVNHAVEQWYGRRVPWGEDGRLEVLPHEFVGLNAYYNPLDRALHFGVVLYRMPEREQVYLFEISTSWEVAAHEGGHAIHDVLKPNKGLVDPGYRQWGESFGDQLAMWVSLVDRDRVEALLAETGGDLGRRSALTRMAEAFGTLRGGKEGLRDALNELRVSDTGEGFHERSQVLTGAAYWVFQGIAEAWRKEGKSPADAVREAGKTMGLFLVRSADHTPENSMTLEDVGKALLKVDKEYFSGNYRELWTAELTWREILTSRALEEWQAHEDSLPKLVLPAEASQEEADAMLRGSLEELGIDPPFALRLQSHQRDKKGRRFLRVGLMRNGPSATLGNHGILSFRTDGSLMDWLSPLPHALTAGTAMELLKKAEDLGLDRLEGALSLVPTEDGGHTVQVVHECRTEGDPHLMVHTLENPRGARHEYFFKERTRILHQRLRRRMLPKGAKMADPHAWFAR